MTILSRILVVVALAVSSLPGKAANTSIPDINAEPNASGRGFLLLVVDKTNLRAELKTWPVDPLASRVLFSFRVAIGKVSGDKAFQGDKKTPEGIYLTHEVIDGSRLPAKYGPLAIPLNFPNPIDLIHRKTGYGIWLHGVEQDSRVEAANVTDGCVAFYNADIERLGKWLVPQQAIVMINDSNEGTNDLQQIERVRQNTTAWYTAWQNRDLDKFMAFYDQDFRHKKYSREGYRQYKQRVFKLYKDMAVNHGGIRVFVHQKYALTLMDQDFTGDSYVSAGRKFLYWRKHDDGEWRIQHESFDDLRVEPTEFSYRDVVELAQVSPSSKQVSRN